MAYNEDKYDYPPERELKFIAQPGELEVLGQCLSCKWKSGAGNICKAFPAGIPDPIQFGDFDHRNPYPGDHGVLYEPVKGAVNKWSK